MVNDTKEKKTDKKKKKGTKERIRDVAIDLFSQRGYNAVSIRDIAGSVNISDSTIYSHYKSKEEIMDFIIEFLIDEFKFDTNEISMEDLLDTHDPELLVNNAIRPVLEQTKVPHIRKILRLMCIELYHNEKLKDFFKNQYLEPSYVFWSQLFQKMMDKGLIMKYDSNLLAVEFFNYCIYLLFECFLLDYNEDSYEVLIDNLINKLSNHVKFIFDMVRINES